MNITKRILIVFLFFTLLSCNSNVNNKNSFKLKTINIEAENITNENIKSNKIRYANIISSKSVDYIPLETTKNSLIGKIDKILLIKDRIYILDKKNSKGVFVFNKQGGFLFKIQNQGKGPGEFMKIIDFNYNESSNELEIFDIIKRKILIYNLKGEFIKEIEAINSHAFYPIEKNERYFYSKFLPNKEDLKLKNNYRLIKTNNKGDIINNFLSFKNETIFKSRIINTYNSFYPIKDSKKLLFIESYNNNIYEIDGESLNIKYVLNFNNSNIPKDFLESNINDKYIYVATKKLAYISNILYDDNEEMVFWYTKKYRRVVRYDKKKEEYKEYLNYFIKEDNIFVDPSIYITNQFGISILEVYKLLEQKTENNKLSKRINEMLKDKTEISNPILVRINK